MDHKPRRVKSFRRCRWGNAISYLGDSPLVTKGIHCSRSAHFGVIKEVAILAGYQWAKLRSVDSAATVRDNTLLRSGDATDRRKKSRKLASYLWITSVTLSSWPTLGGFAISVSETVVLSAQAVASSRRRSRPPYTVGIGKAGAFKRSARASNPIAKCRSELPLLSLRRANLLGTAREVPDIRRALTEALCTLTA
jgi:hypothetical protein